MTITGAEIAAAIVADATADGYTMVLQDSATGLSSAHVAQSVCDGIAAALSAGGIGLSLHGFPLDTAGAYSVGLAYSAATRKITLTPTGANFDVWVKGTKANFVGAQTSAAHNNATGIYYFYFDATAALSISSVFWDLAEVVPIAYVYYNAAIPDGVCIFELHTWQSNPALHKRLHEIEGTQIESGFVISGLTVNSDITANKRPALTQGVVVDEDIFRTVAALVAGSYTSAWRTGAAGDWTWTTGNADCYLVGGTPYVEYNQWTGAVWQLTELASGTFCNYYVFVLPAIAAAYQYLFVPGQAVFGSLSAAQAESVAAINFGATFPFSEIAAVYQITFRAHISYSSAGQCVVAGYQRIVLSRAQLTITSSGAVPTLHAASHNEGGTDRVRPKWGAHIAQQQVWPLP